MQEATGTSKTSLHAVYQDRAICAGLEKPSFCRRVCRLSSAPPGKQDGAIGRGKREGSRRFLCDESIKNAA
jgi:hypothetical protein